MGICKAFFGAALLKKPSAEAGVIRLFALKTLAICKLTSN